MSTLPPLAQVSIQQEYNKFVFGIMVTDIETDHSSKVSGEGKLLQW